MTIANGVHPSHLARLSERQVVQTIRDHGPSSRADVARHCGLSAPTVTKAAASLLEAHLLEEIDPDGSPLGRPAKRLRLATSTAQVLGIVIDAGHCRIVSTGLDGTLTDARTRQLKTPSTYDALLDTLAESALAQMAPPSPRTLGVGVCVPGLVDYRKDVCVFSPNLHTTDGRSPARDLSARLGTPCLMLQEQHALCLAERHFGQARGLDDFAMLDVSTGLGMGVMSGGRLLLGHSGFAGEIGHVTVVPDGRPCGCGNRGCLETVANDTALAARLSRRLRRRLDIDDAVRLIRAGRVDPSEELSETVRYLSIGLALLINLFNPSTLFLHGRLFDADDALFPRVLAETQRRALAPPFADCRIIRAQGSKRQGAVAGIIQHLIDSLVPERGS